MRESVLIVDGSLTVRMDLAEAFQAAGFTCHTCASAAEARQTLTDHAIAIVVLDVVLPDGDGVELLKEFRARPGGDAVAILMLSTEAEVKDRVRGLRTGADEYVGKPYDIGHVVARARQLIRARRSDDAAHENAILLAPARDTSSLLGPKKILAVDDSATYLEELAAAMRSDGYDVVLARSGEEALDMLAVQKVDCILLDLMMPGLGGQETCVRIKSVPVLRDIPLIMLTALDGPSAMIQGLSKGADDYITKSIDFEVVKARVRAQLRRKQFEDENRRMRDDLLTKELEAREARAARELAETCAALVRDLERKNQELDTARRQAEQLSTFKSQFLANMSHELRTPLNAVIGFSELLTDENNGVLSDSQRDFVGYILDGGRHLLTLINDILDLSKIEAGRIELHHETVDPHVLIESAREIIRPFAKRQGVALEFEAAGTLPKVVVDPVRVKQMLFNLLSNAVKFTKPGGTVRLTTSANLGRWVIAVKDTGIGIKVEDIPRLFREFERIESPSGPKPEGTGLGLALTKRLVELHGGIIEVSSTPGEGSTFTVQLPLGRPEP